MQKNRSFPNAEQQCSPRLQASPCNCPYWSAEGKACTLVKEGLFLPTETHLNAYCTSPHFSSCDHFQRLAPQPEIPVLHDQSPVNRRRFVRVPQRILFRFSEISGPEHPAITQQEESWTLNVSEGGLCFASRRRLAPNTTIRFSVEEENRFELTKELGKVAWSQHIENSSFFHYGLKFL